MAFSTITPNQLAQAAIGVATSTLYTVPAATRTFVKDMDICNTTASAITVRVHLVPNAGVAGTGNAVLYDASIPAKSTVQWTGTQVISAGATIQASASNTGVTITISGGEAV